MKGIIIKSRLKEAAKLKLLKWKTCFIETRNAFRFNLGLSFNVVSFAGGARPDMWEDFRVGLLTL